MPGRNADAGRDTPAEPCVTTCLTGLPPAPAAVVAQRPARVWRGGGQAAPRRSVKVTAVFWPG
jgi:hypothetical protein